MAGKGWRSKKILTLVPPIDSEDSDLESDDDEERRIESHYWSNVLRFEPIASAMPLKRYKCIKRDLHFCDNTNVDPKELSQSIHCDRVHHVRRQHRAASRRPLRARRPASHPALAAASDITAARPYRQSLVGERSERKNARRLEGFANVHGPPRPTSHPIRVKAGHRKQYNPKKPHKWGFKFLVRAGTSGMVYDFFAYDGSNSFQDVQFTEWEENYLGVGGKTVVRLCKTISNPTLCTVYFDNWFTSLELLYYLRNEWGILSLGTIRKDRLRNCSLSNDKDMKKKGRGAYEVVCDNDRKLAVTKWVDNQCIHIASSFCAQDPVTSIERYDKKQKKRVSVTCPKVIKIYNLHMGGVDVADMLTALYRIHMKTRRWYMSIFAQVLDIALNKSWLLHRRDCLQLAETKVPLKKFRVQIALTLIKANTKSQLTRVTRQGRVTASKVYEVGHCSTPDGSLVEQILGGYKMYDTKAMKRGKKS
ncbi:hypothetical protein MSG28_013610 [Choristoneura fumiferana]|uniref:Uncharacterized protein n=1 Tax=Choristoneura fumiferana TaxID=7141 RepID=A0ACC0K8B1_CHOFU|nr:hypothetical protein MSG28_013610 [Choristoneura fumiferana]